MTHVISDDEITLIVRERAKGSAINRDGSTSHRIARAIESAVLAKLREQNEPVGYLHKSKDDNSWDHLDFDSYDDEYGRAHWASFPLFLNPAPIPEGWRSIIANFIHQFKRHVGGDGEFWLHELEDFYTNMAAARSGE